MLRDQIIMLLATNVMFLVCVNAASLISGGARKRHARVQVQVGLAQRAPSAEIRPSDR